MQHAMQEHAMLHAFVKGVCYVSSKSLFRDIPKYAMQYAMLCAMSHKGMCCAVCYAKICYAPMFCEGGMLCVYVTHVNHVCDS